MAIERSHYEDRPQALVKHTFLHHYLPALVNKVSSFSERFIYVDGFAGPWQAADEENFTDTSFGIALNAMADAQRFQQERGRRVRMIAHLVEKDDAAFQKLEQLRERYPSIEVHPYHGKFESHFDQIRQAVGTDGFCFAFIDPKGVSLDLALLKPLLSRRNTEVLINFMFDFVNRFVDHPEPGIVDVMNRLIPGADWRGTLDLVRASGGTSKERERILVNAFRAAVGAVGDYPYVPSLTVQKALADRTLYHLVFATRHPKGLSVFRSSQNKALKAQAEIRAAKKDEKKVERTGQGSLFGGEESIQFDPSAVAIEEGRACGTKRALELILASPSGVRWDALWPVVLDEFTITEGDLAKAINAARKAGTIQAPGWPSERHSTPGEGQILIA